MTAKINILGKRFGKLIVIEQTDKRYDGRILWLCKCDCGNEKLVPSSRLTQGRQTSCGCSQLEAAHKAITLGYGDAAINSLITTYKWNAKNHNREYILSRDEAINLFISPCVYCGAVSSQKVEQRWLNGGFTYNGIDRIDNSKGYILDNCVSCCKNCNLGKRDMSLDEFMHWIKSIYEYSCL